MPEQLVIPVERARRFQVRATLLDSPAPDLGTALATLGYVQIDPINVCGRMHDLILRHRVAGYRQGDLVGHLHGSDGRGLPPEQRLAFEHHMPGTHILVAFPQEAWPHLVAAMQARTLTRSRWSGRLTPRERELAVRIKHEIAARGPLSSDEIADRRSSRPVWGNATLVKATMQKLFFHGELLIAGRVNHRRKYDLPERVLPAWVLAMPRPSSEETARWLVAITLRQRRVALLRKADAAAAGDLISPFRLARDDRTAASSSAAGPPLYCLRADLPVLLGELSAPVSRPRLLAPLDPVIYDRRLTRQLWDFDYTWEAYTPPAKRKRGYYAMPLLCGTILAGHVDSKADRENGRLRVAGRSVRRGFRAAGATKELASFLGLKP